jgi:hypothetical protein
LAPRRLEFKMLPFQGLHPLFEFFQGGWNCRSVVHSHLGASACAKSFAKS